MTISVAPAGTPIGSDEFADITAAFKELSVQLGITEIEARNFASAWASLGGLMTPKAELLWRLNESVKGRDPGKPRLWRGL